MTTPPARIQVKQFLALVLLCAPCSPLLPCSWAGSWENTDFSQFFICFFGWGLSRGCSSARSRAVAGRRVEKSRTDGLCSWGTRGCRRVTAGWQLGVQVPIFHGNRSLGAGLSVSRPGARARGELSMRSGRGMASQGEGDAPERCSGDRERAWVYAAGRGRAVNQRAPLKTE